MLALGNSLTAFRNIEAGEVLNPVFMPDVSSLLVDAKVTSASDVILTGSETSTWKNYGVGGMVATDTTNLPEYNLPENCNDYITANEERLTYNAPVVLDWDHGLSMLVGCRYATSGDNDKYVLGGDNSGTFSIFVRSFGIIVKMNTATAKTFRFDNAAWGLTKRTGKFIMEITKPRGSQLVMRLTYWNGSAVVSTADSTGDGGTETTDLSFFNVVGGIPSSPTTMFNDQIGVLKVRNKAYETTDTIRDTDLADAIASYTPD